MRDPVCGMEINPREAVGMSEFEDGTYYFCSSICKEKFDQDPRKYLELAARAEREG